jgi:hypothetical protein
MKELASNCMKELTNSCKVHKCFICTGDDDGRVGGPIGGTWNPWEYGVGDSTLK